MTLLIVAEEADAAKPGDATGARHGCTQPCHVRAAVVVGWLITVLYTQDPGHQLWLRGAEACRWLDDLRCVLRRTAVVERCSGEDCARRSRSPRDPLFVSYRHPVGYRRSPGNLASVVTRSISEWRMSLWSTMVVSPQGLLDGRAAPEGSLAVEHLSWPDHRIRTGSTTACNDLIHTWDKARKQPLFRPAPHLPRPPHRPSRRHLRLRESWEATVRSRPCCSWPGRQVWRAEGAPLKL